MTSNMFIHISFFGIFIILWPNYEFALTYPYYRVPRVNFVLPLINWEKYNPIFRIDNTFHIIDVQLGDSIDIVCPIQPKGADPKDYEYYAIYRVTKEEYDTCQITFANRTITRLIINCTTPTRTQKFTLSFRRFSPMPGGMEFVNGEDYYFTSTSTGTLDGINNLEGGHCNQHAMKITFKVGAGNKLRANQPNNKNSLFSTQSTTSNHIHKSNDPDKLLPSMPPEAFENFEHKTQQTLNEEPQSIYKAHLINLKKHIIPALTTDDKSPMIQNENINVSFDTPPIYNQNNLAQNNGMFRKSIQNFRNPKNDIINQNTVSMATNLVPKQSENVGDNTNIHYKNEQDNNDDNINQYHSYYSSQQKRPYVVMQQTPKSNNYNTNLKQEINKLVINYDGQQSTDDTENADIYNIKSNDQAATPLYQNNFALANDQYPNNVMNNNNNNYYYKNNYEHATKHNQNNDVYNNNNIIDDNRIHNHIDRRHDSMDDESPFRPNHRSQSLYRSGAFDKSPPATFIIILLLNLLFVFIN